MLRLYCLLLLGFFAFIEACGPVPTDSSNGNDTNSDVYANDDWGFQVSRPDSTWGLQAQVYTQLLAANGLPVVEVWLLSPTIADTSLFRPVMYLKPDALVSGDSLQTVVSDLETELGTAFEGYAPETKQSIQRGADSGVEWQFQAINSASNFMPGTQFWIAVLIHKQQVYLMLGSGIAAHFPIDAYHQISLSLAFKT